ncbi:MAG: 4-hydroxybenzoate octaprenyltransferase [Pseudomonadales bacterium]|nr:4-hydroxybenzoate octaprenyltransferase [Pseudomonadales bacterium]
MPLKIKNANAYLRLMRVDRPIGTYLVAWPALWSLWLASEGFPGWRLLVVFLAGAFLMRSAGCVINDYADRNIDGSVERTRERPLASGEVEASEALTLFVLLALIAASLLLLTNWLTAYMAVAAVATTAIYPFMKRYTHLPQVVLGMAFSFSVPMAFAATSDAVPATAWLVYFAVVCWVVAYDTYYAMVDRDDDIAIGVKSTAILFGHYDRAAIVGLQILFVALMLSVGLTLKLGILYYVGLLFGCFLLAYQYVSTAHRDRSRCFAAFLNNNYVGMAIFIGIALDFLLRDLLARAA